MAQYPPIMKDFPALLHGGDYNPEQWIKDKDTIWKEDMERAREAGINTLSVGIFSWSMLEPAEGEYHFEWLDEVMDMLAANGMKACLATPSGARPAWMAEKYPEVLRVDENGHRHIFGVRHNHCLTSPIYREKVRTINTLLAERYKNHPALGLWHISNEYGGKCYCPLCRAEFRNWLKERYGTIENLNDRWWNSFWSHRFSSFDQIDPPMAIGEVNSVALDLAWKRFNSHQYCDFYSWEIEPLKRITPEVPCTTNLMHVAPVMDYFEMGRLLDVSSWDNYPTWTGDERDSDVAAETSFRHALMRGVCGGKPFMMMESSPSATNWQEVNRLRRTGVLQLQSLQAIAYGSDSVQYFQFRATRGAWEKHHGAVISHDRRRDNRVYREVCRVGERLKALADVRGSAPENRIALLYDYDNAWVTEKEPFLRNDNKKYMETAVSHYVGWARAGYDADVIDQTCSLEGYRIVCGPMTYMLRPGFAEKVKEFVRRGGTYVSTYCSGMVDEEDLCFLGGFPGPLSEVCGIWNEETDAYDDTQRNHFSWNGKTYEVRELAAVIHAEGARVLSTYEENFYAGTPALTENTYGEGSCFYIAPRTDADFLTDFYGWLGKKCGLAPLVPEKSPEILCTRRVGEKGSFLFVMNPLPETRSVTLPPCTNAETGEPISGTVELSEYEVLVVREA